MNNTKISRLVPLAALVLGAVGATPALGQPVCAGLPTHADLTAALNAVVDGGENGGLGNEMWATIVNRDGVVCAVTFSGGDAGDQWPGSRVISAQKANTANAFSLPSDAGIGIALSTANLWGSTQPGSPQPGPSLYGLQFSNPVSDAVAYGGPSLADRNTANYGQPNDPLVGRLIGGVNVFGGGLGLYNSSEEIIGALGLSGDTSCSDHIQAWKVRDALELDFVPGGVSGTGDDNMVLDVSDDIGGNPTSAGGFGHPDCGFGAAGIIPDLPENFPIGNNGNG